MDLYRLIIGNGPGVLDGYLLGSLSVLLIWVITLRRKGW